jgi:hypothetical protein
MLIAAAIRPDVFIDAGIIFVVMIIGLIADVYEFYQKQTKWKI